MGKVLVTLYVVTPSTHQKMILGWRIQELTPALAHSCLGSTALVFGATMWEASTLQSHIPQNTAQLQVATPCPKYCFCEWVAPGACSTQPAQPYAVAAAALLTLRPSGRSRSLGTPPSPLKHPLHSEASLQMLPDPPLPVPLLLGPVPGVLSIHNPPPLLKLPLASVTALLGFLAASLAVSLRVTWWAPQGVGLPSLILNIFLQAILTSSRAFFPAPQ